MNDLHWPELDPNDVVAALGLVLLAVGVALITVPAAALVVTGSAFLAYAVLASRGATP